MKMLARRMGMQFSFQNEETNHVPAQSEPERGSCFEDSVFDVLKLTK
jgi:hypothetical protein